MGSFRDVTDCCTNGWAAGPSLPPPVRHAVGGGIRPAQPAVGPVRSSGPDGVRPHLEERLERASHRRCRALGSAAISGRLGRVAVHWSVRFGRMPCCGVVGLRCLQDGRRHWWQNKPEGDSVAVRCTAGGLFL
jgi:hypothetical protein